MAQSTSAVDLSLSEVSAGYGQIQVIRDLNLVCREGEITALLGRNGAGKTTLLSAIAGLLPSRGSISIGDNELTGPAYTRTQHGLAFVQEGKRIFRARTVEDNLRVGGYTLRRNRKAIAEGIEAAYGRFPILGEKRHLSAGLLSGGQQQMLGIAQALMTRPRVLLLDEPSAGLAPAVVQEVFGEIAQLRDEGLTVLLVEQLVDHSLRIADHVAVLDQGRLAMDMRVSELSDWSELRHIYLGA